MTKEPDTMAMLMSLGPGIVSRYDEIPYFSSANGSIPRGRT